MSPGRSLPEPDGPVTDIGARFVDYLDYFRSETRRKVAGLGDADLGRSITPSGWTMPDLVDHLVHMERRWLVWGFLAEDVPAPRADRDTDGRWSTDRPIEQILDDLGRGGERTRQIVATRPLTISPRPAASSGPTTTCPTCWRSCSTSRRSTPVTPVISTSCAS